MRVILGPDLYCGQCGYCRPGRYIPCQRLRVAGCQATGATADAFTAPAGRFHAVPDSMTDAQAALLEPLSTAVHAVRMVGQLAGAAVAVPGGGTIGLLTVTAAVRAGARAVAVSDPRDGKRQRALRLGAASCAGPLTADPVPAMRETPGGHADVTFDCVSSQASTAQAIRLAENGGTVMVTGVAAGDVTIPLPVIQHRQIRLAGSAIDVRQEVLRAIELMADGAVPAGELVTATLTLTEGAQAFKQAASGHDVKIHLVTACPAAARAAIDQGRATRRGRDREDIRLNGAGRLISRR